MKKILLLLLTFASSAAMMAQSAGVMTFVGASSIKVFTANVETAADTVLFKMNGMTSGDITLHSMSYTMGASTSTIPSFTIHDAKFSMDMKTMTATFEDQTFTDSVQVNGVWKKINGTSLSGTYKLSTNTLDLVVKFKYGSMPFESTYTINGYYVKPYTNKLEVIIGGSLNYENSSVTYKLRKYKDGDVEKVDVEVPTYVLTGTQMGDLTIGTYTVTGLTYDEAKGGFYKDYINDGLQMYFTNGGSMNGMYALSNGNENILVTYSGKDVKIVNNFQPGKMPFPITSTFDSSIATEIKAIEKERVSADNSARYNLAGQRVSATSKGIVIINGRKYLNK